MTCLGSRAENSLTHKRLQGITASARGGGWTGGLVRGLDDLTRNIFDQENKRIKAQFFHT